MLASDGDVRTQVETEILQEQGLRDLSKYSGIMGAIASGRTELTEIADRAGLSKDTTVRGKVETIISHRDFVVPQSPSAIASSSSISSSSENKGTGPAEAGASRTPIWSVWP